MPQVHHALKPIHLHSLSHPHTSCVFFSSRARLAVLLTSCCCGLVTMETGSVPGFLLLMSIILGQQLSLLAVC